ncbi:MAG: hypothetical protein U9N76_03150 [Candidatus Marinimicrobia bacterium]|nr:hypothetical protein [Candidatus Neomarinimicrobiota bacterium]
MKKGFLIIGLFLIFSFNVLAENYDAVIVSDKNEKFTVKGTVTEKDGILYKKTDFINEYGKIIIEERGKFISNPFKVLEISIRDVRNGRTEIATKQNDNYILKYIKKTGETTKTKVIDEDGILMHGSFVPMFIIEKYDELSQRGKTIKLKMLVPLRQTFYNFELIKEKTEMVYKQKCNVFKLEATSWVIRALTKPSYFYVTDNKPHQLVKYSGSTLITDSEEEQVCGIMNVKNY